MPGTRLENGRTATGLANPVEFTRSVCRLAGSLTYIEDVRSTLRSSGIIGAVRRHDTPALFDWLMRSFSYQGVSDTVAASYLNRHGSIRFADVERAMSGSLPCPKLRSYWHYCECGYRKSAQTCGRPDLLAACCVPAQPLRNGRLNQTAFSLFLFIRDMADSDLINWIDRQLEQADHQYPLRGLAEAVLEPLGHVHGISRKVLSMTLADLLIGAAKQRPRWLQAGAAMVAVDTLVHNFLHRTGLQPRLGQPHLYGPGCYGPAGCAETLLSLASQIDARAFSSAFPAYFPRFIQHAIWRYCAQRHFDVCNGNRINDRERCSNIYCKLHSVCDRIKLVQ